jgi:predicted metal-dependent peptidase
MFDLHIPEAANLFAQGRRFAIKRAPYLSMLYKLVPVQVAGLGTMGVSAELVVYYDPEWLLTDPEIDDYDIVGGIICHEAMHPSLNHLARIAVLADKSTAGICADYTINPPLLDAGWRLPSWAVHPTKQGLKVGLTLEQYYELCMRNPEKLSQIPKKVTAGTCGGAVGNPVSKELEDALATEVGRSKIEQAQAQKTAAFQIKEYAEKHGWGSVPGASKDDAVFQEKRSKTNWRQRLRHVAGKYLGNAGKGGFDYSLAHPSQRALILGVIRPGLIDPEIEVALIRDTSGSMDDKMINVANNEIIAVMKQCGLETVWLLDADTKVQGAPRRVHVRDIPKLPVLGRGGTSFVQPLEAVTKLNPRPDVIIYLTDGYGTAPARAPVGVDMIWCTIPPCREPASWGTIVECKD